MGLHKNVPPGDVHVVYAWAFANATVRASFTGAASGEIGKVAWQQDDDTFWVLVGNNPMRWTELTNSMTPPTGLASEPPPAISTESGAGTGLEAARGDHTHAHASQTDPALHAVATPSAAGFMGTDDKTKLDSVQLDDLPTHDEKNAMEGTADVPGATNRFVTEADTRLSNPRAPTSHAASHGSGGSDPVSVAQSQVTGLSASLALKADDSAAVHKTGDETLAGTKTFSSPPVVPTPVNSTDAAHKGYVDGQVSAVAGSFGPPVADAPALRAIASAGIPDRQVRLVEGLGALYRYDTAGTGTDDGNGVIKPTDAGTTGRWFKAQAATQDHEQLTGLLGGAAADHYHLTNTQVGYLPATGEKAALAGTSGTPGSGNKYVTDADSRNTNARLPLAHAASHAPGGSDGLAVGNPVAVGLANAGGSASTLARSDHVHAHGSQTDGTLHGVASQSVPGFLSVADKIKLDGIEAGANNTALSNAIPTAIGNAVAGTADTVSRADHVHSHGSQGNGNLHDVATQSLAGFMAATDKLKLDGVATGATNTPLASTLPVSLTPDAAGVIGVATAAARADHVHDIQAGTPIGISDSTNYEGTGASFARADHVHGHGALGGGSAHAVATPTSHGFMSSVDKEKLDGIGAGGATGAVLQMQTTELDADTSTNSSTWVDLLTVNVTTVAGSKLMVHFTAGFINTGTATTYFRVTVDGTAKRGVANRASNNNYGQNASAVMTVPGLASGAHVVKLQWRVSGNVANVRPVTNPDSEHATLLVEEFA